ncbi:MAG TPA: hypothetical protein PKY59_08835 [Pyrinomonadaceae bacterium]|nr:hypothetical protein [Pyrinomonadaceae bacterium]
MNLKDVGAIFVTVFVPIILLGLALWLIVHFTSHYEGIASVAILGLGIAALAYFGREIVKDKYWVLLFIFVFSFLGLIFDRAGNFIYNTPYRMMCPPETVLVRDVSIEENYEGDDVYVQTFSCFSRTENKSVKELSAILTLVIRFLQYILLGLVLVAFTWVIFKVFVIKKGV